MKLIKAEAKNFGSYKSIDFDFEKLGLALISGPTGSGKSTLQDLATWILFGCTAKSGTVDEVRSWNSKQATEGSLLVKHLDAEILITRVRGKSSENDLYWKNIKTGQIIRGKNILETQISLNNYFNIDEDLFIAGSYFHEFSLTSTFFNAKTKDKRFLFEKLAFLELPILLEEKAKQSIKTNKSMLQTISSSVDFQKIRIQDLNKSIEDSKAANETWELDQKLTLSKLEQDAINWSLKSKEIISKAEETIKKIKEDILSITKNACPTCGFNKSEKIMLNYNYMAKEQHIMLHSRQEHLNPFLYHIEKHKLRENQHEKIIATNLETLKWLNEELNNMRDQKTSTDNKLNLLNQILELSYILRSKLLEETVYSIQKNTNEYIEKHFDGEIRVNFSCKDSDTLDVTIEKNGYKCEYTQLSKGQRGILKLCFGIAVMKSIAERAGIYFNTLFFDEALDGLDSDMKIKAFGLFKSLEQDHESILLIDHESVFQNLFDTQFKVTLEADCSKIDKV